MMNLSIFLQQSNDSVLHEASNQVAEKATDLTAWLGLSGPVLGILGGILLLIVGYFVAKFFGRLVRKLLQKTGIDKRTTNGSMTISKFVGKLVYYLLMIIVLMATLTMMGVSGDVLAPLNQMTSKFFGAIPNILAAGIIAYVGYFLAKIVADLIEASGDQIRSWIPKFSDINDRNELDNSLSEVNRDFDQVTSTVGGVDIVKILKNLAFIFVFVPLLILALDQLNMRAITDPATNMLDTFINAIPNIIYAVIIMLAAIVGGKILVGFLKELLSSLNVNNLGNQLQLNNVLGNLNLVNLIGSLAYIFIVYIGVVEAAKHLGLTEIVDVLDQVLAVAGKVVFGLMILALGNVVANFTTKIFLSGEGTNKFMAALVKGAVMVIFLAMGLHAMGIANDIIELAFGLGLGAIAVAFALSFGLGGREAAGHEVKEFFAKMKKNDN